MSAQTFSTWKRSSVFPLITLAALIICLIVELERSSCAQAETEFTPDLTYTQRYDSNVFFAPKSSIPPEKQSWDLVSTLGAGLKITNKSRYGDNILRVGASGAAYAYNTDLSYGSVDAYAFSDVSDWLHSMLPRARLQLSDSFLYTPEPPAFLTGGKLEQSDIFARGLQAYRSKTYTNNFAANGGYSLSREWDLLSNYTFSIRRTGQIYAPSPGVIGQSFFDTTAHKIALGPNYRFDDGDTLFFQYSYLTSQSEPTVSTQSSFSYTAHTIQPRYTTRLVRDWRLEISGGATLVQEASNRTFFSGSFSLQNNVDRRTSVVVSASRQTVPAYFGTGGALISNLVQLNVNHRLSRVVRLIVNGSYGYSETTTSEPSFQFTTFRGFASLDYQMTRSTALSLSQDYTNYDYTGSPTFDRYVTMLTLRTEWR